MPITQAPIVAAPAAGQATSYLPNIPAAGAPAYVAPPDPLLGQVLAGRYLVQKKLGEVTAVLTRDSRDQRCLRQFDLPQN